ncbi:MAG TPA: gluconate 2-dehydrogenase subunit 3 family protein [Gammaproteobacteria bacterium]|nr:gluconate 2-dehydrogenase subunit 3 family protein [Gammaproteobacteria bacterium]
MASETTRTALSPELMSRREALIRISALLGGTMVGSAALLSGCATRDARLASELFSPADIAWLDEIADTILPPTETPGAKAAEVGAFISVMVADTYTAEEQATFLAGLATLDDECRADHGVSFMAASPAERTALLERLDREQYDYMQSRADDDPVLYFRMLKELALLGYFTSEIGYRQAMRYVEAPGRFDPCLPYTVGERAWAPHA